MTFEEKAAEFGIALTPAQLEKYARYYAMLVEWNARFNLTAVTEKDEVYAKHFADSLAGLRYMRGSVCDVGAGAGFPSLVLAVAEQGIRYTLLDSVNKKVTFLNAVIQELGLTNAEATHIRAEDAGRGAMRESFDTVTARAVAPIPTLLEYLSPLAKIGGRVVVYKTNAEEEMKLAQKAVQVFGLVLVDVFPYHIDEANRCIMVFEKRKATPRQYPRGGNKPRIMPL